MTLYGGAEQYTSLRKRQLLAHELGHFWGIDDLYFIRQRPRVFILIHIILKRLLDMILMHCESA